MISIRIPQRYYKNSVTDALNTYIFIGNSLEFHKIYPHYLIRRNTSIYKLGYFEINLFIGSNPKIFRSRLHLLNKNCSVNDQNYSQSILLTQIQYTNIVLKIIIQFGEELGNGLSSKVKISNISSLSTL